jgi:hypothetical protein
MQAGNNGAAPSGEGKVACWRHLVFTDYGMGYLVLDFIVGVNHLVLALPGGRL